MQRETPSPPSGILPVATDGDWLLVDGKSGYTLRRAPAERNTKHRQPPDDDQLVELYNLKRGYWPEPRDSTDMNSYHPSQASRWASPEPRCVNRQFAIRTSFLMAVLLGAFFCADAADEQPFTPPADLKGAWSFTADPKLPNVLIIGDSISIGYTRPVREKLAGKANVHRPMSGKGPDNCGDTTIGLKKIDGWLGHQKWDVIHFNWGLWDLCYRNPTSKDQGNRDKIGGKISSKPADYEKNLEQLVTRLEATGAKLIWANTTVVPEGEAGRFVGDDEKYNAIAARVMKKHGIATDDLFTLTKGFAGKYSTKAGDVHYTSAGYERIAVQVAGTIEKSLTNTEP